MLDRPPEQERWGLLWRPYHTGVNIVADFYTNRNLYALASLWNAIQAGSFSLADQLRFAFTSIVLKCSKMMAHNSDGIGRIQKGTLYIPAIIHDVNVWSFFCEALTDLTHGYQELSLHSTDLIISTDDARLIDLPANSVDYVFTDPPYSWKVQFGESNFIWESWLGVDTSWLQNEIIVNEIREKTENDWEQDITRAMAECFRVLKPGRWLSMCYHDTSEGTWQLLQDLMTYIGFIPDTVDQALYIDAAQKSIKQVTASQVARRDLVVNFRKPGPRDLPSQLVLFGDEDASTFADKARAILAEALEAQPGSTADRLYDTLVSRMVRKGTFERHNFDQLLRSVAEEVVTPPFEGGAGGGSRWYLLDTAGQVDEAEGRKEAAAAGRLEAFMRAAQAERSSTSLKKSNFWEDDVPGVHYSDLFEQYLLIPDKPRRLMQEWLPEYFFKTGEGTWRPPADAAERAQKTALRTSGALRRIKRFAHALQEGVPPAERDRPANVATAADWIRQCRRAGLYELGRALYEKGGFDFAALSEEGQLAVEEDYALCVRRG